MQYKLKNISGSTVEIGALVPITNNSEIVLYDDTSFQVYQNMEVISSSLTSTFVDQTNNLNYLLHSGLFEYYEGVSLSTPEAFYTKYNALKPLLTEYYSLKSEGLIVLGIDLINSRIVIGTRALVVGDIPQLPATKISSGTITDDMFNSLSGVRTDVTIQQQFASLILSIDDKANLVHNHTSTFFLSTPALTWDITHNLGVIPPAILVRDTTGEVVIPSIKILNNNSFRVTFSKLMQAYVTICI